MAKKDKVDGTPIEFYIPGPGKGPKVPVPINQPNWMYKWGFNSKPEIIEWISIVSLAIIVIGLGILLALESMYKSALWIVVIALGTFTILLARSAIIRSYNYKNELEEDENVAPPSPRKKKLPKPRKDYK